MILHLGGHVAIPLEDIIAIIDMHTAASQESADFIVHMQKQGKVRYITGDAGESLIIASHKGDTLAYMSPISTSTLQKRAHFYGRGLS